MNTAPQSIVRLIQAKDFYSTPTFAESDPAARAALAKVYDLGQHQYDAISIDERSTVGRCSFFFDAEDVEYDCHYGNVIVRPFSSLRIAPQWPYAPLSGNIPQSAVFGNIPVNPGLLWIRLWQWSAPPLGYIPEGPKLVKITQTQLSVASGIFATGIIFASDLAGAKGFQVWGSNNNNANLGTVALTFGYIRSEVAFTEQGPSIGTVTIPQAADGFVPVESAVFQNTPMGELYIKATPSSGSAGAWVSQVGVRLYRGG